MNKTAILKSQIGLFGKDTTELLANGEKPKNWQRAIHSLGKNIFFTLELTVRRTKHLIIMTREAHNLHNRANAAASTKSVIISSKLSSTDVLTSQDMCKSHVQDHFFKTHSIESQLYLFINELQLLTLTIRRTRNNGSSVRIFKFSMLTTSNLHLITLIKSLGSLQTGLQTARKNFAISPKCCFKISLKVD